MKYFLFFLFFVGALGSGVGLRFIMHWQRTMSLPGSGLRQTQGAVSNNAPDDLASTDFSADKWSLYRNTEYGFEFEYPSIVNGQELTVTKETPLGRGGADVFYQFFISLASPFEKEKKMYRFELLTLAGVDMLLDKEAAPVGLFVEWAGKWVGGYDYDGKKGTWKAPAAQAGGGLEGVAVRELTWDQFLKEVEEKFAGKTIRTKDGLLAIPQEGVKSFKSGEPYRFQYYVFNKERKLAVNVVAVTIPYFTPVDEATLSATPGLYEQYLKHMQEANTAMEVFENTPAASVQRKAFETEDAFLREVVRRVTLSIHFF